MTPAITGHANTEEYPDVSDSIRSRAGENPLRFLALSELDTALAVIRGIRDTDRLDAWREAELDHVDPPRDRVLDALDDRERELTGEPVTTDPEPAPEPTTDDPEPVAPEPAHADLSDALPIGHVLVVYHGEKTEYIWPARDSADAPYVERTFDGETLWMELTVDAETVEQRRRETDHELRKATDVTVDPHADAVTEVSA